MPDKTTSTLRGIAEDARRKRDLAKLHIAPVELGMDEETRRALTLRISKGRTDSTAKLSSQERNQLLAEYVRLGWKPKTGAVSSEKRPLERKIEGLWQQLHEAGVVRNGSSEALASFARRLTGVDALRWASVAQLQKVVEALKAMERRGK
ncbi:phage protein GemA/Gp16 family protein [Candidatus Electronema sp. JM]|uniref:phage protein GemA/Gp16 family protein n=1 Tax=Candidatus Electronema sp. JM TaxID=3401571 RepID=UPI003AA7E634